MEQGNKPAPRVELLADPDGYPLGRVIAPRPGPVVGRASGTVYLNRLSNRLSYQLSAIRYQMSACRPALPPLPDRRYSGHP